MAHRRLLKLRVQRSAAELCVEISPADAEGRPVQDALALSVLMRDVPDGDHILVPTSEYAEYLAWKESREPDPFPRSHSEGIHA